MYYLYKDTFLSGWGQAKKGSYVISDKPLKRPEFKKLGEAAKLSDFKFGSGKDRHFELWTHKNGQVKKKQLYWVGKNKPLSKIKPKK